MSGFTGSGLSDDDVRAMLARLPATPTQATMAGNFDPAGAAGAATPTDWAKIAAGLGALGKGVSSGMPGGVGDAAYLRVGGAGPGAYSPGGVGLSNLLATLMQMHRNAALAQQPPLQAPRASLLG